MKIKGGAIPGEVYSADDIAQAAGVDRDDAERQLEAMRALRFRSYVTRLDAIRAVRMLAGLETASPHDRAPLMLPPARARRSAAGLVTSGALHLSLTALIVLITSLGLLNATATEEVVAEREPARLVFLSTPGPGGGGGGGGLKMPKPAARAERKAIVKPKTPSPVPEVRPVVPPPPPVPPKPIEPPVVTEPAKIEPPKIEPPKVETPPAAVNAPVAPMPADASDKTGVPVPAPPDPSHGSGTGGGAGSGAGTGLGEGRGSGIGAGSDGGYGGGPYRAGAGIDPPRLLREVKATYTDDARRRGIEGQVLVEIVVRRDGSVGDVRVLRSLPHGLDQKAIEAVRQWRFEPARRHGEVVDVIVEVSLQFKLR